ncbi:hypothetical protein QQS21_003812 [Conoideocrella luteorostrata]|uniref:NAD(P)-binding protein n=1 Tax=Conoideocrella luteorostrata TaxID=1105319 RepID=A0AAJ0CV07_9HYPO|nr:hypothetical protein QQS21_003812 [Conoideocrella luteorostrata]
MSSSDDLLVLGNDAVHDLLISLSRPEIIKFHDQMADCLIEHSIGQERQYQPEASIVNRPEGHKILFRPFTSPSCVGTKIVVTPRPAPVADTQKRAALGGIVTLCDTDGKPLAIINAKEVTGYRTTMSAMIPFLWRRDASSIVVFGAGLQALWHTRLALALRGSEIKSITVVNRSLSRAQDLIAQVKEENATWWKSQAKLESLDPSLPDYDDQLRSRLEKSSVIFCTVGSTSPVFPANYIGNIGHEKRATTGPLITGVGSWQADMIEIDPGLVKYAVQCSNHIDFASGNVKNDQRAKRGVIVVDSIQDSRAHAGEVVQSGLTTEEMMEVGEIIHRLRKGTLSAEVQEWIASGLLIYKSIGVSTTDIVAGEAVIDMAKRKHVGTLVPQF